jgi:acetylornithine deacetylase/succinyl-diaminopimelate desuccinylase-like protein
MTVQNVLQVVDDGFEASMTRLFELLRFASIATDPAYNGECLKAANWLVGNFTDMGFKAQLHPSTGQPMVIATYEPPKSAAKKNPHIPHILFYGHYDVQPADPASLWTNPPFEPTLGTGKSGRKCIYARGSADDKGQFMCFTEAVRHWLLVHGSLPFALTIFIEGDEEGDTSHADRFVAKNKALLKADVALVCDTGMWDDTTPAIVTSLRGCVAEEVTIKGPSKDLHSGYYGGAAVNPLKVLSGILGRMFDDKGHITIPGFYKGVKPPTPSQRKALTKLKLDHKGFLGAVGLKQPAGEKKFTPLEQMWLRPTAEINGMWGGYIGTGGKTVIPSIATAKLTFRLVAGQKPAHISKAFRAFIRNNLPKGCTASFQEIGGHAEAVSVSPDSPWISAASRALSTEWGKPVVLTGEGGSIPVVEAFKKQLGLDSVMMGFVRDDDALHSPDEKYDVECYHKGIRSFVRLIDEIAKGL